MSEEITWDECTQANVPGVPWKIIMVLIECPSCTYAYYIMNGMQSLRPYCPACGK